MLLSKRKYRIGPRHYYLFFLVVVSFICLHFNNIKIANVKVSELTMLMYLPFALIFYRSLHKYILLLLLFFFVLLLITFISNPFQQFFTNFADISILKEPYFITISRFLEYICCVVFLALVYKTLRLLDRRGMPVPYVLQRVLLLNMYFGWLLIAVFLLHQAGVISAYSTKLYYSTMRLRGLYLEGGPYGLMYAFLFALSTLLPYKNRVLKATFLIVIALTQSKAGILMVFLWLLYGFYQKAPSRYFIKPLVLTVGISVSVAFGLYVGQQYIDAAVNIEKILAARPNDPNVTMGRVAGVFITPRMIAQNPVAGVGLGNYSIVRNDPNYRGFFPPAQEWDLPGLGGLVILGAENGIIGLLLLAIILALLYRDVARTVPHADKYILLFILPGLLGVQLYFPYIWLSIGVLIYYAQARPAPASSLPPTPAGQRVG